jgi:hypothetical protein
MKLETSPIRSPERLYTAVPSTLSEAIRRSVSSVATELPRGPIVAFCIVSSTNEQQRREANGTA